MAKLLFEWSQGRRTARQQDLEKIKKQRYKRYVNAVFHRNAKRPALAPHRIVNHLYDNGYDSEIEWMRERDLMKELAQYPPVKDPKELTTNSKHSHR